MYDGVEFYKKVRQASSPEELCFKYGFDPALWQNLQSSPVDGYRIVIRMIEGGNPYMHVGQSFSGWTPIFAVGFPIVVEFPNGYYQSSYIRSIDWEAGTFRTQCSTYTFSLPRVGDLDGELCKRKPFDIFDE